MNLMLSRGISKIFLYFFVFQLTIQGKSVHVRDKIIFKSCDKFSTKLKYDTSMMILSDVIDLVFTGSRVPLVIFHPFFMRCTAQTLTKW